MVPYPFNLEHHTSLNIHYVPPGGRWEGDKWREDKVKSLR